MDKQQSTAQPAHPPTEDHDDTVEAHYSSLERLRPHACVDGWVYVGYIDEHGEEREASYAPAAAAQIADSLTSIAHAALTGSPVPPGPEPAALLTSPVSGSQKVSCYGEP